AWLTGGHITNMVQKVKRQLPHDFRPAYSGYQNRPWQLSHTPSMAATRSPVAAAFWPVAASARRVEWAAKAEAICLYRRGSLSRWRWTSAIGISPSPTSVLPG